MSKTPTQMIVSIIITNKNGGGSTIQDIGPHEGVSWSTFYHFHYAVALMLAPRFNVASSTPPSTQKACAWVIKSSASDYEARHSQPTTLAE